MGNGNIKEFPKYDQFAQISTEYDKLKAAGLSQEEIHGILNHRFHKGTILSTTPKSNSKDDEGIRRAESTTPKVSLKSESINSPTYNGQQKVSIPIVASLPPEPAAKSGLVLLIDDSPVAAKVASKILTSLNFDVVVANSAKSGFDILLMRKDEIDLIFLDVVMPNVDGVECLAWIKENSDLSHVPVYMLSGLEDQTLTDVCIERGAEGMLLKPLNVEVVKSIMRNHNIGNLSSAIETNQPTVIKQEPPKISISNSVSSTQMERDNFNKPTQATKLPNRISTVSHQPILAIGSQAPSFKLLDSDFNEFVFPHQTSKKSTLLIFIPTIFCSQLYDSEGFLMKFFQFFEQINQSKRVIVACISGDLPYSLKAAKKRFKLPFILLSDPSLSIAQKFVGCINIGQIMSAMEEMNDDERENGSPLKERQNYHKQNALFGPNLGMVLLNRKKDIMNKWVSNLPTTTPMSFSKETPFNLNDIDLDQFPNKFAEEWIQMMIDGHFISTIPATPRHQSITTQQSISSVNSDQGHIESKEEKIISPSSISTSVSSNQGIKTQSILATKRSSLSSSVSNTANDAQPVSAQPTIANDNSLEGHGKMVLVIDDSSVSSRVATKKLESIGYTVHTAYQGQQGFELVKKKPPNFYFAIVCDIVMPVCDGINFLKLIKDYSTHEGNYDQIPIIMLSGLESEELSRSCLDLGANGVLKKPFDEAKFSEIIREVHLPR